MPTYEYLCKNCRHNFDIAQSIKADVLVDCPQCELPTLRRVIHAVAVLTKGEAKTLAQQADRNEKAMGRLELEEKRIKAATGSKKQPKPSRPWWRKTDKVDTNLADLAPAVTIEKGKIVKSEPLSPKAENYIMTGKK